MNALDTNILIYSIDANDATKCARSARLIESLPEAETIIPWQVACEVAAVLTAMARSGRYRGDAAEGIAALRGCFPIALPKLSTLERSLRIQSQAQLSIWNSLLIAACADAGVSRLCTEDMPSRPVIEGVELVNPFR